MPQCPQWLLLLTCSLCTVILDFWGAPNMLGRSNSPPDSPGPRLLVQWCDFHFPEKILLNQAQPATLSSPSSLSVCLFIRLLLSQRKMQSSFSPFYRFLFYLLLGPVLSIDLSLSTISNLSASISRGHKGSDLTHSRGKKNTFYLILVALLACNPFLYPAPFRWSHI